MGRRPERRDRCLSYVEYGKVISAVKSTVKVL